MTLPMDWADACKALDITEDHLHKAEQARADAALEIAFAGATYGKVAPERWAKFRAACRAHDAAATAQREAFARREAILTEQAAVAKFAAAKLQFARRARSAA